MSSSELHQLITEYTNSHIRRKCQVKSYISSSQNTPTAISEENVKLRVTSAHHRIHQQPYQKKMSSYISSSQNTATAISEENVKLHQLITEYTNSHIRIKCQVKSYISSSQNTPTAISEENVKLHQLITEYSNSHIRRKCQVQKYISSSQNTATAISEENVNLRITSAHHRIHQQPYQKKMPLHQLITEYTNNHIRRKCRYISSSQNTPTTISEENVKLRVTSAHHRIHQQPYQKKMPLHQLITEYTNSHIQLTE